MPVNLALGTYYIGAIADYANAITESDETNNSYNRMAESRAAQALPDLRAYIESLSNTTIGAGGSTTADLYDINFGTGAAAASTTRFYLSTDATITTSDTALATTNAPALVALGLTG